MAIITGFKSGKSYTFKNLTTEKMLNLYGGRTDKGTNAINFFIVIPPLLLCFSNFSLSFYWEKGNRKAPGMGAFHHVPLRRIAR